jgi:pimeloyl-ACP methyl ester carboxylesterase
VNGLEIAYGRVGEGPPLVLVHGATMDSRMWQPQLAALADQSTVVAWDEPGAGRSSDVPAGFGLPDYARCLAALIAALERRPAHVAGLSWGGTVVFELYRHRCRPRHDVNPRRQPRGRRRGCRRACSFVEGSDGVALLGDVSPIDSTGG